MSFSWKSAGLACTERARSSAVHKWAVGARTCNHSTLERPVESGPQVHAQICSSFEVSLGDMTRSLKVIIILIDNRDKVKRKKRPGSAAECFSARCIPVRISGPAGWIFGIVIIMKYFQTQYFGKHCFPSMIG